MHDTEQEFRTPKTTLQSVPVFPQLSREKGFTGPLLPGTLSPFSTPRRPTITISLLLPLLISLAGLLLLLGGGELLVGGARDLARHWGMPPLLIGLTVLAFGTSVPELFISLAATWRGFPGIMLGNVIGSNIANIGLILGISLLISPLRLAFKTVATEMVLLHLVSAGLFGLAWWGYFPRPVGWLWVAILGGYTVLAYRNAVGTGNHEAAEAAATGEERSSPVPAPPIPVRGLLAALLLVAVGLVALAGGSELFLRGAVEVARSLGISELVIGLTLAAVGTSLPELATCVAAIRQRQDAMLVGNIIGSNLFNLLMVMGSTASLLPFALPPELLQRDLPVMLLFSLLLLLAVSGRRRLGRGLGLLLVAGYGFYLYLLV